MFDVWLQFEEDFIYVRLCLCYLHSWVDAPTDIRFYKKFFLTVNFPFTNLVIDAKFSFQVFCLSSFWIRGKWNYVGKDTLISIIEEFEISKMISFNYLYLLFLENLNYFISGNFSNSFYFIHYLLALKYIILQEILILSKLNERYVIILLLKIILF